MFEIYIYNSRNLISRLNSLAGLPVGDIYNSRNLISRLNLCKPKQKNMGSTTVEI